MNNSMDSRIICLVDLCVKVFLLLHGAPNSQLNKYTVQLAYFKHRSGLDP